MSGQEQTFRYLFLRGKNEVFLLRVAKGGFLEKEIAYFAAMAEKYR
jgi:hypothetical protein